MRASAEFNGSADRLQADRAHLLRRVWVFSSAWVGRAILRLWPVRLGKVFLWRVINRLNSRWGVELVGTSKWGGRFMCSLRDLVQSRIYYTGVWEPSLTDFIMKRMGPGDVFVDIGANVGYFTVLAANLVGDEGRVIAIEASPRIHAKLCDNVEMNRLSNVVTHNCAVSDASGRAEIFAADETNVGHASLIRSDGGVAEAIVDMRPLDLILTGEEFQKAKMIKIDVEGFEGPVLQSLLSHSAQLRDDVEIVVELAPKSLARFGMSAQQVLDDMTDAGFRAATLHNSYDWDAWHDTSARPPVPLGGVPTSQVDLVFTRERKPAPRESMAVAEAP